ncbi:MAG: hypothetical protein ACFE8A_07875 [Candidatus Hodarchaeota archaeon]
MEDLDLKKRAIIIIHGIIIWVLCGMIMYIGMSITSIEITLIIHAIFAPIFACLISFIYFKKFNYTTPLITATIFVAIAILLDIFIVALLIEQSFEMFTSFLGTWLVFILIFAATFLTGFYLEKKE